MTICTRCSQVIASGDRFCPHCGAPVNVADRVSDSGWEELPTIRDMARIQFGRSICQIEGTYVPVADMGLVESDSVYFSHHVLLWAEPGVGLDAMPLKGAWNRMYAGIPLVNEPELLMSMIRTAQASVEVPICIDSSVIEALEAGLSVCEGRALVNSVTAEDDRLQEILVAGRQEAHVHLDGLI